MPTIEDFNQLDLRGMRITAVALRAEKLRVSFGSGYGASALVGAAFPLHEWTIGGPFLPDVDGLLPALDGKNWFEYHYDFFVEHTLGATEYFVIAWRNKHWHVRYKDPEMSFDVFKTALMEQGPGGIQPIYYGPQAVVLEQAHLRDVEYNEDGSLGPLIIDEGGAEDMDVDIILDEGGA